MIRKETLLARKYELQNTLRVLRGEEPYDLAERTRSNSRNGVDNTSSREKLKGNL